MRTECKKLWNGLREDEQSALQSLVQGSELPPGSDVARRLRLKSLILNSDTLFSSIFSAYVTESISPPPVATKVQVGPIRIDHAGDVWLRGKRLDPPLTASELQLLTFLCTKPGQLCSKDEIDFFLHPKKYQQGVVMSDAALEALVRRLRERIEIDPNRPEWILTIRGRGYMLQAH